MGIHEKNAHTVKNFGIWVRYDSRQLTHNMYKEYRDITLDGAVSQMYQDLNARYRARFRSVQILKTAQVAAKDVKRDHIKQFCDSKIKFPICHKVQRAPIRKHRGEFQGCQAADMVECAVARELQ